MKKILVVLCLSFAVMVAASAQANAEDFTGNVNFSLGLKTLDDDDWEPMEEQGEFGVGVDFRSRDWPVNLVFQLLASADDDDEEGIDVEASTSELRFGFKKIWELDRIMRPFFGGGLAFVSADLDAESGRVRVSDDDSGIGVWISGGIYWTLNRNFNLGFELGYSTAEVTLFDEDVDAGGTHAALVLGYHW